MLLWGKYISKDFITSNSLEFLFSLFCSSMFSIPYRASNVFYIWFSCKPFLKTVNFFIYFRSPAHVFWFPFDPIIFIFESHVYFELACRLFVLTVLSVFFLLVFFLTIEPPRDKDNYLLNVLVALSALVYPYYYYYYCYINYYYYWINRLLFNRLVRLF